ncbi:SDR family NAD(P)-dependent oxidoreductase [archaeon]|jgi:short-subunit dehydrogenase|nr:SDR family NAD(P)-dependent oxidoreductase [archaeon]MBT6824430.1 SDR family NAD(P)-dependent oxidoreductase [archaeon]MBT7107291.1 SDR family NAD(P)-dependent oxidoreductase [archaeon]MBT7297406.1 SDR family NAD(P)-dependent oxidoreductase [archaeon]
MKKVLITGASSGLGLEIGKLCEKKKFQVINLSRNKSPFQDIIVDLSDNESISKTVEFVKKNHPDFDILILNSGIMPLEKVGQIEFDIDNLFKINIVGTIKLVNELFTLIKKNKTDLVFVGSTASLKGSDKHSTYCASKHAVEGFIRSLQVELKNEPIRVIGFHPGGFNSNLREGIIKEGYMESKDLATLMMDILDLPKTMEVSEIVINRKKT